MALNRKAEAGRPVLAFVIDGQVTARALRNGPQRPRRKTVLSDWREACETAIGWEQGAMNRTQTGRRNVKAFALFYGMEWHLYIVGEAEPRMSLPRRRRDAVEVWLIHKEAV